MASLSFKREFLDTGIVSKATSWCFGQSPVISPVQVKFAAGFNKFSICAGFTFTSAKNDEFPEFKVVYCAKPRSKIFKADPVNHSKWFIWYVVGSSGCIVITPDECKKMYGFDVARFFETTDFQRGLVHFKNTIERGIDGAKELLETLPKERRDEMSICIKSLEEAVGMISENPPKVNDVGYKLIDYDKFVKEFKGKIGDREMKRRGKAMNARNKSGAERFVNNVMKAAEKDAENSDGENGEGDED